MGAFSDSIKANSAKILATVNDQCYDIAFELFTSVINLTPSPAHPGYFAKGLLANQWYPSNSKVFSSALSSATSDDGSDSRDRLTAEILGSNFEGKDGVVTMTNNVPYVELAETVGWRAPPEGMWSGTIGPYRMVALSIQAIAAKYK